ncbi:V-type ATP synthase subunit B [Peptoniphilus equinus]|uniref:V-type ATP synthase beta chain n=1 Tax=Peptoniphilus equinus TaxID=3016343 RepID=A0ABY7QUB7_9FIRM|nr:V-type ATP synthase subunit B [Peptoniphilus equinus]WBW49763.1 V-type ATP synthase subunit B [Peptoniphilus equinus]
MRKEYLLLDKVQGSMIELSGLHHVAFGEIVEIKSEGKDPVVGRIIGIVRDKAVVQVFGESMGISTTNTKVIFEGKPFEIPLSGDILGRVFNGIGRASDKGGPIYADKSYNVNGRPMNPVAREYPRNYVETGIRGIDALMTLIRGQKLPIFSGSGLPHNELAAQIVRQAHTADGDSDFAVVFCGMGLKREVASYFIDNFLEAGVMDKVVMYLNYADDPIMERIIAPKCALTAAEYLAFEEHRHVLVIMTDMTSYGEALREVSSQRSEVPSRKGYPGYLYSDLAAIYERAGMIKGVEGSVTLIPILTMPSDDITHPIPDLTGYITEGQIVLSRDLNSQGIYPPIDVLPSLSRLMKDGIGDDYTRDDHPDVSSQLFASYSRVIEVRALAQIIGEEELPEGDKKLLEFGRRFEEEFIGQDFHDNSSMAATLDKAWELLHVLPEEALERIDPKIKAKYY